MIVKKKKLKEPGMTRIIENPKLSCSLKRHIKNDCFLLNHTKGYSILFTFETQSLHYKLFLQIQIHCNTKNKKVSSDLGLERAYHFICVGLNNNLRELEERN